MALAPLPSATTLAPRGPRPLRVVILDDDAVFRTVLSRMLLKLGLEVVATCSTIDGAKRQLATGNVDAVTVDVVLKGESGLDFLKWCHQNHRGVVTVLVTAGSERGARTGVDAVFLGAAALLTKPEARSIGDFEAELRRVFNDGHRQHPIIPAKAAADAGGQRLAPASRTELLAVGASTGGPPVLLKLLKGLPATFDVPMVITQHMPALHIPYLAELLTQQGGRRVVVAADGLVLQRHQAYLAGNGKHLLVERRGEQLISRQSDAPAEHFCKPAVDPMFRSVAKACAGTCLGVVMTGMGSDGASGATALRARANPVIVQDEASSVVWGMPGSVVAAGAADGVYSADRMPAGILEWMGFARGVTR
jgi:two-component system, chemotaxis family, protein-glutamate methylesterase/glutaminase